MIRFILAAMLLAGPVVAQTPPHPLVIAHRGASGERPEHTRAAYELAIDQGADFIEPDLVMSRDGHLVVRHENEISETTDVAARPEFAERRTTKTIEPSRHRLVHRGLHPGRTAHPARPRTPARAPARQRRLRWTGADPDLSTGH
nr:glycerophosphodiester phosphodiesterase family protein [Brevundimonas bacteroides]